MKDQVESSYPHLPKLLQTTVLGLSDLIDRAVRRLGISNKEVERLRAEKAILELRLQESDNLFRQFMNYSPTVAFMKDEEGRMEYANPKFEKTFDMENRNWFMKSDAELWPEEIAKKLHATDLRVLASGRCFELEEQIPRQGELTDWMVYKFPFVDAKGKKHLAGVAIEVTHLKRHEQELRRQAQELARSNQELERFAYVASHDLQEPLRMVASYCELLAKKNRELLSEESRQHLDYAVEGARRMQELIYGLLDFSRASRGKNESAVVDVNRAVETALANLQASISETRAKTVVGALPSVRANGGQLSRLFQNLIGNAIKFQKLGVTPEVTVGATETEDEWIFHVSDNGIGIPEEYFSRIFQLFQRLHTRQEYAGTGIGLALCKKIVENHGGRFWLESTQGVGSTFYFSLPKSRAETPLPGFAGADI